MNVGELVSLYHNPGQQGIIIQADPEYAHAKVHWFDYGDWSFQLFNDLVLLK